MAKLRLYDYAASANCYKVRLLLAQLGRSYERIPIDIFAGGTMTADYVAKNPMRTTPVIETEDGRFLPESNAILLYLADGTPFLPDDPFERAQVVRWLIYEQTDVIPMMGGLRFRLLTGRLAPGDAEAVRRKNGSAEVLRLLDVIWESERSSLATATRSPTSASTATSMSPTRQGSASSHTHASMPGSDASRPNPAT